MTQQGQVGYLIFDKCELLYLSRNGISFGWSFHKNKAAVLTQEQVDFWIPQLIRIKGRGGFSVLMVAPSAAVQEVA